MISDFHKKTARKIFILSIRCFFNPSINMFNFIRINHIVCINISSQRNFRKRINAQRILSQRVLQIQCRFLSQRLSRKNQNTAKKKSNKTQLQNNNNSKKITYVFPSCPIAQIHRSGKTYWSIEHWPLSQDNMYHPYRPSHKQT